MSVNLATFSKITSKTVLQILPIALSMLSLSLSLPVVAQERNPQERNQIVQGVPVRTLTVTGRGVKSIPTTITQVRLGVEVQAKTAQEAQQEAAKRSTAVITLLKSRNVEKLETTGINLNPIYSYENNTQKLTGYSATNTVSFRIPTGNAGNLLDEAVKAGATRIDGVSFIASDSAISTAQQQALKEATQDAQKQADAVLSALNLRAGEVIGIQINGAYAPPPVPVPMPKFADARAEMTASTPIEGGEQQVEASVTLQIRY